MTEIKHSQHVLLNFIATSRIASEGIIDVSYERLEFGPRELSKETLHDYEDCSFLAKINSKASYIDLKKVKDLKNVEIRELVQENFLDAFQTLFLVVQNFDMQLSSFLQFTVVSIITSVTSEIILKERIFTSEEAQNKFSKFLEKLADRLLVIINEPDKKTKHDLARKCAAWVEYRMSFADRFFSETLIGCNAASLLLAACVLLLADCDFPIFLGPTHYFLVFSIKDPDRDIDEQFESFYLKKFKIDRKFQPEDLPRKLKTLDREETFHYYENIILDNMHILSETSTLNYEASLPQHPLLRSQVKGIRKNASHYVSLLDSIKLIYSEAEKLRKEKATAIDITIATKQIIASILLVDDISVCFRTVDLDYTKIKKELIPKKFEDFITTFVHRIINHREYDIFETLAKIDYEITAHYHFFEDGNARVAQALIAFVCMYFEMAAPEIVEGDQKQRYLIRLPLANAKKSREEEKDSKEKEDEDSREEGQIQFWYKFYTTLFDLSDIERTNKDGYEVQGNSFIYERLIEMENEVKRSLHLTQSEKGTHYYSNVTPDVVHNLEPDNKRLFIDHVNIISKNITDLSKLPSFYLDLLVQTAAEKGHIQLSEQKAKFENGWSVLWENLIEDDATIYQEGMRSADEITLLKKATGYDEKQLVVFMPQRMVLHKFIVYLITHYQITSQQLLELREPFLQLPLIQNFIKRMNSKFGRIRHDYEIYLDQCYFDDPLELMREVTLHKFIEKTRLAIRERVSTTKCKISPSQARKIMRMLAVDELLRDYFEPKANRVVQECFDTIRDKKPDVKEIWTVLSKVPELPYRKNHFQRIAWAVVGGPASGKSTLKKDIKKSDSVCQINPDDYKPLLYTQSISSKDSKFASLVHEESSYIADQIMKTLKSMAERPDVLLDVVKSSEDKMDVLAEGGAKLHLIIATCEPADAIQRAFNRAVNSTDSADLGRFVPTREILAGHKKESVILPSVIKKYLINLRLFDTGIDKETRKPLLVAEIDTRRKELKVFHLGPFLMFIRKALINEHAVRSDQVYLYPFDGKAIFKELMRYINAGITLTFIKSDVTYVTIDPVTGLSCYRYEELRNEFIDGGFPSMLAQDLLLFFAFPNYCNGYLVEAPGKPLKLLDIELADVVVVRNQASHNKLWVMDSSDKFEKLSRTYPVVKILEPTPLHVSLHEVVQMIHDGGSKLGTLLKKEAKQATAGLLKKVTGLKDVAFQVSPKLLKSLPTALMKSGGNPAQKSSIVAEPEHNEVETHAKKYTKEERDHSIDAALSALQTCNYDIIKTILVGLSESGDPDDVNKVLHASLLSYHIFPLAKQLKNDSSSEWLFRTRIPETIRKITGSSLTKFRIINDKFRLSLKLATATDPNGDHQASGGPSDDHPELWQFIPIDDGESFHIFNIRLKGYLKLGWSVDQNFDRILYGSSEIEENNKERFEWYLIPQEGGTLFRIKNKMFESYLLLSTDLTKDEERKAYGTDGMDIDIRDRYNWLFTTD